MATTKKKTPAVKEAKVEVAIQRPDDNGKMVINHMPVTIRSVDRSRKDITDWWNALQTAESVFYPNRSDLYDIYSTVILDAHLSGIIEKRIATVLNKKLYFEKGGKKDDSFDKLIGSENFRLMLREIMLQKFWGLTGFEFIPGKEFQFNLIPRKHIKPESCSILSEQWDQRGSSYEGVWNLWVLGDKDDMGILLKCTPLALWKKGNMADWAQYIEIFGQPFIVFTYDANDKKTKEELDTIMRNIGSGTKLQKPKQVELQIEDGKQNNGNGELQDKFRNACNQEMTVFVLGATETTTSSSSSGYAQSKEHGKQQDEVIKSDTQFIRHAINSQWFLQIVQSYGYDPGDGGFCHEKEIDLAEVATRLKIAIDAKTQAKLPVGDEYLYELTGIPKPENYDKLKEEMKQAAIPAADPPKPDPVRSRKRGKKNDDDDDDLVDEQKEGFWKKLFSGAFFAEART